MMLTVVPRTDGRNGPTGDCSNGDLGRQVGAQALGPEPRSTTSATHDTLQFYFPMLGHEQSRVLVAYIEN